MEERCTCGLPKMRRHADDSPEKLRDMLGSEPVKLSVNVCVGTVLGDLNN
jgi:hypothetical protein